MELSNVQWNGRAYAEFRDYLLSYSDEKYRAFQSGLCKTSKYPIIGVRLPIMQKISSEIVKGKPLYFLMAASVQSYEEIMIRGLVTAKLKMPLAEKFVYIEEFLPYIDNWAVCDSFCTALKPKKNELYMLFEFCKEHAFSQNTYEARAAVVLMMRYLLTDEFGEDVISILENIDCSEYYVGMAVAWALSESFIKFREKTLEVFSSGNIDAVTQNRAIQKIRDSYRVSDSDKALVNSLKR